MKARQEGAEPGRPMAKLLTRLGVPAERFAKLRGEMGWVLAGQALSFLGGFAGIKILTTMLGPKGYGEFALGLTIAGLLNLYLYGPISNVVARFFSVYRERGDLGTYFAVLKNSHKVLAVVVVILAVVAGGIAGVAAGRHWGLIVVLACLFGVIGGINVSFLSLQSAVRQRRVVALHQGGDIWLRVGLSIGLLYLLPAAGYVALLAYLGGTLIVTLSQRRYALKSAEIQAAWRTGSADSGRERATLREFLGYATPFVVWAGIAFVSIYGDRWILQYLFGEREVGIYAALYQIAAAPINLLVAVANQLATPIIFERAGSMTSIGQSESSTKLLLQTVVITTALLLLVTLGFWFLGRPIVRYLTTEAFVAHYHLLWVIALGLSLFSVGQLLATKGLAFNRPKIYIWPKAVQNLLFLVLALYFGSRLGMMGVAASLCCSSFIHLVLVVYVNRKLTRLSLARVGC